MACLVPNRTKALVLVACLALPAALSAPGATSEENIHCAADEGACAAAAHEDWALLQLRAGGGEQGELRRKNGELVLADWSRYDKVEWIGFGINTFPNCTYTGISTKLCFYPGNSSDAVADVIARINIMETAINSAYEAASKDSSILKVFAAPEFYFRGPHGAYEATSIFGCAKQQSNVLAQISKRLSWIVAPKKFSDWLFIMGTVVAAHENPAENRREQTNDDWRFYNFAPIYKGGPGGKKFIVEKEYISSIDFLSECLFPSGKPEDCVVNPRDGKDEAMYSDMPRIAKWWMYFHGYELVRNNAFEVDGVRFGVEICLDHKKNALSQGIPGGVQVHLVTSAGMDILYSAAIQTEPVFLQDGHQIASALTHCNTTSCSHQFKRVESPLGAAWKSMLAGYYNTWFEPFLTIVKPFAIPAFRFHGVPLTTEQNTPLLLTVLRKTSYVREYVQKWVEQR